MWRAFARFARIAGVFCGVSMTLVCCTSFDPYNVLQRQNNPHNQSGAGEWSFTASPEATTALRRDALNFVWQTIHDRYCRADYNGVDWIAARTKWEPIALNAANDDAFWEALDQMAGELGDAHTRVESPSAVQRRRAQQSVSLGLGLRVIEGQLVVGAVHRESDAFWAGVRPGMVVLQIDTIDALKRWTQWQTTSRKSSTPQAEARWPLRQLNALAQQSSSGVVRMVFARELSANVHADKLETDRIDAFLKPRQASARPTLFHRVLPSGIGYIRLSAFSESLRTPLLAAIAEFKDTPALILDLRGNGGGSAAMSEALIGAFFKEKTLIGRTETRSGQPVSFAFGAIKLTTPERHVPGRADAYTGRVVVLIDGLSASASEATAAALQSTGRAKVVGETSCGCLLAYLGYASVPGGGELAYSEIGLSTAQGERVEGRGVVPDVLAVDGLADLRWQRDRPLEAAVSMALNQ
ncbi:MAG: hypothetical protein EAZ43_05595 [Betaproteobacteria bacterium]|nr:MAG: hypothetical protein EAZ43_05595 [Betaproteobacteria bacterium]